MLSLLEERPGLIDESCVVASHTVSEAVRDTYTAVIVEGELQTAEKSWLQHRIVVVELAEEWIVIDAAVRQCRRSERTRFSGVSFRRKLAR